MMAKKPLRVLVVDDEESMRYFVRKGLQRTGYEVHAADGGAQALEIAGQHSIDLAVVDLMMPGMDGIEVLTALRELHADVMVVIMTGHATIATAVDAMRRGAWDYVTKPFELEELQLVLERAVEHRAALADSRELRRLVDRRSSYAGLLGQSPAMRAVFQVIDQLERSDATVLIEGESGTGKELVARALHSHGARKDGPFLALHCAAMPEKLLENELFGHAPGAFTGAQERKLGLLAKADGGTLFLDEVGEIPPPIQSKLERFIQEKEFFPLGDDEPRTVDVRLIAATNRDLVEEVEQGRFRSELFYRLRVVPLTLPPLRQRREDVPVLAQHFLERCRSKGAALERFTPEALVVLANHDWPGNVRELENAVERMAVLHRDQARIDVAQLPTEIVTDGVERRVRADGPTTYQDALVAFETDYLVSLLKQTKGNISETARLAGLSRGHLHRKVKQLGLETERFRE